MNYPLEIFPQKKIHRRDFLLALAGVLSAPILQNCGTKTITAQAFITCAPSYSDDIKSRILSGFKELNVKPEEIRGKKMLLKPNLVEPHKGVGHINTHPLVVRGVAEAFYSLGAVQVLVAEGAGHIRDTQLVLEESGLADVLFEDRISFIDFNNDNGFVVENQGKKSRLKNLPAVDATCCRIMGINPIKIKYLKQAAKYLGPIKENDII